MKGDADVAAAAALIGEPARAALLLALMEAEPLSARELAARAGIAPSTASGHLKKLVSGGFLADERQGRHRYFRLADPAIAEALEALSAIAPTKPVRSLREASVADAVRHGRMCYDHLAGRLGVELAAALERKRVLIHRNGSYTLGSKASTRLAELGIDLAALEKLRRVLVRPCLDWSERRPHLAGALGAEIAVRLLELGWLKKRPTNRSVEVTPTGLAQLRVKFGIELGPNP